MGPKKHPLGYLKEYPRSLLIYNGQSAVRSGVGGFGVIVGGISVSMGGTSVWVGGDSPAVQAVRMSIIRIIKSVFFTSTSCYDHHFLTLISFKMRDDHIIIDLIR
jgi:hypothetical protein